MTHQEIRELDVVALLVDLPGERLLRGDVGTVVHVYQPGVFEVEFCDNDGRTHVLATLNQQQVLRLNYDPSVAA